MRTEGISGKCATVVVALLSLTVGVAQIASAGNDIGTFLNAPVWYVEYSVSLTGASSGSLTSMFGPMTYSSTLERSFSAAATLDMRMQGPSPVLGASFLSGTSDGSRPSAAEQMKYSQAMMSQMDEKANWTKGPDESMLGDDATMEEVQAASKAMMDKKSGPAKLEYVSVVTGTNLVNELGQNFVRTIRTTRTGAGTVLPEGGADVTFEVDAASKKYSLILPPGFDGMGAMLNFTRVQRDESPGEAPIETKDNDELGLASFPSDLALDDQTQVLAGMILIRGDIEPSAGKISGERSLKAHYTDDNGPGTGTLVVRYSLSMTPPAKPTGK